MYKHLIDTNILIRLIVQDDKELGQKAKDIFLDIEQGRYKGIITPLIIAEVIYVLYSKTLYGISKDKIQIIMDVIFSHKNIIIEEKAIMQMALRIFVHNKLDFADCYLLSKNKIKGYKIITFDKKLDRMVSNLA